MARPRSDIAPRILRAARERFLQDGVDGASLRNIARDAGTSIGMVYYYFQTKDDLFTAVVEEVYERLLADLEQIVRAPTPFVERLEALYQRVGAVTESEAQVVRLVLRESLSSQERFTRLIDRFQRGHVPLMIGFLAEGMSCGALTSSQPPGVVMMAAAALGTLPHLMRRALGERFPVALAPTGAELSRALVHVLLNGLGQDHSRSDTRGTRIEPA